MTDQKKFSAQYAEILEEIEHNFWEREFEHPNTPPDFPP